jgi:choline dehydrogenase-like flavoprotein
MKNKKVAIIGSGLSAISAAKALISRGVKPVIFDVGEEIEEGRKDLILKLSKTSHKNWLESDRELITNNDTVNNFSILKKLAFGSDYFYSNKASIRSSKKDTFVIPPSTHATGGFSVAWGAASLLPDDFDLTEWPISRSDLLKYYEYAMKDIAISSESDDLNFFSPVLAANQYQSKAPKEATDLLYRLNHSYKKDPRILFGKARLFVNFDQSKASSCRYCGCCMSGCVYGAIYTSEDDLKKLIEEGKVEYRPGIEVVKLVEIGKSIKIVAKNRSNNNLEEAMIFNKVFMGAGVVNSTRIVMESKNYFENKVTLKTTSSFVVPIFKFKRTEIQWPETNTMPSVFIEIKNQKMGDHWMHCQVSSPNELVLNKIRINFKNISSYFSRLKKYFLGHFIIAHCNIHSNYGVSYNFFMSRNKKLCFSKNDSRNASQATKSALYELKKIFNKINYFPLTMIAKSSTNSISYHLGCTMPMKFLPTNDMDTDILGRPKGFKNLHIIDSSIFPSLPATGIGALAMVNAFRIAKEADF